MLHKLRDAMDKRDGQYTFMSKVEIDEGFFSTERPEDKRMKLPNGDAGSLSKTKVFCDD